jgi:hypothetical protein
MMRTAITVAPGAASPLSPQVIVDFNVADGHHTPGDNIRARYRVTGVDRRVVIAIEHSVVWYTEGKGEEDLGVLLFERKPLEQASEEAASAEPLVGVISGKLPPSPLSYEGLIVKIRWCVRVRVFFVGGRDFVSEHVFFLGNVPVARPLEPVVL